ncbi:MAG: hypothetical protein ACJAUG_003737 [Halioglobus sp.]|jgi:hypothetical protein
MYMHVLGLKNQLTEAAVCAGDRVRIRANIMVCGTKSMGTKNVGMNQVAPKLGTTSAWLSALTRSAVPTTLKIQTSASQGTGQRLFSDTIG